MMSGPDRVEMLRRRRAIFPQESSVAREEVERHRDLSPAARLAILFDLQSVSRQLELLAPTPDRRRLNAADIEEEGNSKLRGWLRRFIPV